MRLSAVHVAVVDEHRQVAQGFSCLCLTLVGLEDVIVRYFEYNRVCSVVQQLVEYSLHAASVVVGALFLIGVVDAGGYEAVVVAALHESAVVALLHHRTIDFLARQSADAKVMHSDRPMDAVADDAGYAALVLPMHECPAVADVGYSYRIVVLFLNLVWLSE